MMSAALLMAAGGGVYVFLQREEPAVATVKAAEKVPEPTLSYGEPKRAPQDEPRPEVKAEAAVSKVESKPEPEARTASASSPAPKPEPRRTTTQGWSVPDEAQIQKANGPRYYGLTAGAAMGLTIEAIGIYNAPVFDSSEEWALDSGVRHLPETSMPWSKTPQRNVYLEGHRLGYAGTGSYLIFYNLDKLKNGDEVLLKDRAGKSYEYRVIASFVVNPTDTWVTGQVRGRDLVTLQTCTNAPAYDKRLIVRAERV